MKYTVQEVSSLSGVSVRTLRYYDEIGLLKPAYYGDNGYRYYEEPQLVRLQHILFFRELELPLGEIRQLVMQDFFNQAEALRQHRQLLMNKIDRLHKLLQTIDKSISNLEQHTPLSDSERFDGFQASPNRNLIKELRQVYMAN